MVRAYCRDGPVCFDQGDHHVVLQQRERIAFVATVRLRVDCKSVPRDHAHILRHGLEQFVTIDLVFRQSQLPSGLVEHAAHGAYQSLTIEQRPGNLVGTVVVLVSEHA